MPAPYACHKCHQLVGVDVGMHAVFFGEGGGPTMTVHVRCPHCGEENTYEVPRQVGGIHPMFNHGDENLTQPAKAP
jgi:hypothetical protein